MPLFQNAGDAGTLIRGSTDLCVINAVIRLFPQGIDVELVANGSLRLMRKVKDQHNLYLFRSNYLSCKVVVNF